MLSIKELSIQVGLWLVLALCLGEVYWQVMAFSALEPVISAGIVTSVLALVGGGYWARQLSWSPFSWGKDKVWWLIAGSPLLASLLLSLLSGGHPTSSSLGEALSYWPYVIWVPLVEELFYRGALSSWLRTRSNRLIGSYGASLIFCLMHAEFTWRSVWLGNILLPLGPLLLAWCAEYIFMKTSRLCYCIAFHASCNASVLVFELMDERWLDWLDFLYLKG